MVTLITASLHAIMIAIQRKKEFEEISIQKCKSTTATVPFTTDFLDFFAATTSLLSDDAEGETSIQQSRNEEHFMNSCVTPHDYKTFLS